MRSRRYHVAWAAVYVVVAVAYFAEGLIHHRQRLDLGSQLVGAAFWLFLGLDHVYRAAKVPANPRISGQDVITNSS
ncbi:MAG TPA: hypothetical protein VMD99_17550 [Terriglobales bacterium]|nr:hypothetical protein [Terriglobales bacterium]